MERIALSGQAMTQAFQQLSRDRHRTACPADPFRNLESRLQPTSMGSPDKPANDMKGLQTPLALKPLDHAGSGVRQHAVSGPEHAALDEMGGEFQSRAHIAF